MDIKEMELLIADMRSRVNVAIEKAKGNRDEYSACFLGMLLSVEVILETMAKGCASYKKGDGKGVPPRI